MKLIEQMYNYKEHLTRLQRVRFLFINIYLSLYVMITVDNAVSCVIYLLNINFYEASTFKLLCKQSNQINQK